jgi:uncharacterized membrane-anchored protein
MMKSRFFILGLLVLIAASLAMSACNSDRRAAQASLEKFMKAQGVKSINFVGFVTNSAVPGRAYLAAYVTWNFADRKGDPQKERIGVIMKKNENEWLVEKFVSYTEDSTAARELLEGKKPRPKGP